MYLYEHIPLLRSRWYNILKYHSLFPIEYTKYIYVLKLFLISFSDNNRDYFYRL